MLAPCVILNNGQKMPMLGLGTWQLEPGEIEKVIELAINAGYRHFDCAFLYDNEAEIGLAIKKKIADGTVKREDLFIVTKLWCTFCVKEEVVSACKRSLQNFGLDYVDQYLIHWPVTLKNLGRPMNIKEPFIDAVSIEYDFVETWKGMEECVNLGLAKGIGISNFNSKQIEKILKAATIKPVVNQVEVTPNFNQKKLIKFCKDRGIVITAYSPFGSPSRPWAAEGDPILSLDSPELVAIGKKYVKTGAQIVLRYLIEIGVVPLPKSANEIRLVENINIFDFSLSEEDIAVLDSFNSTDGRVIDLPCLKTMPNYPFDEEF
ncbi:hypothetical protein RN001_006142 [Aquatica leii]|uniref:NADP-dependent oxidoreductase domain-containing protein n=1 Tax=Aquatica leii TaxID=1421715 RepID=A0AAN7SQ39_9COLE|nr:hypothetical protein RN001_006142 [Aquatica leii]